MGPLDGTDDARSGRGLSRQSTASLRLGVEGRLEILEHERVVEDAEVGLRETAAGRPSGRGVGEQCTPGNHGADESASRRREAFARLGERAVTVDGGEEVAEAEARRAVHRLVRLPVMVSHFWRVDGVARQGRREREYGVI